MIGWMLLKPCLKLCSLLMLRKKGKAKNRKTFLEQNIKYLCRFFEAKLVKVLLKQRHFLLWMTLKLNILNMWSSEDVAFPDTEGLF